ncbi:MAG: DUF6250 domain-containing protein [Draconibacterium sp.]|nr:DUF6250 domain-containing protein [Draconibacterium sp.]
MNLNVICGILLFCIFSCTQKPNQNNEEILIHESVISNPDNWIAEIEDTKGSTISFSENKLEIDVSKGATIWFKEKLAGNIIIEYDATVISKGGPNDRVSDLNCFWMFSNPAEEDGDLNFGNNTRNGKFSNYHKLQGYYVGLGGHNNSKTRFRRYNCQENRNLLREHDLSDKKHLITPNKKYRIQLVVNGKTIKYIRDGEIIFNWEDGQPLKSGWFAFRTVRNHMIIENYRVKRINSTL